jgi:hypothetical protein
MCVVANDCPGGQTTRRISGCFAKGDETHLTAFGAHRRISCRRLFPKPKLFGPVGNEVDTIGIGSVLATHRRRVW